ncbi:MAG: DUF4418 family protein [Chloroflexi bacterium]|nr:DUF4418 family protein [Chloroflexota bacterium]
MKAIGSIFVVLALGIGIVPQFTNCAAQGRTLQLANGGTALMKCFYSARAELAMGFSLLVVGGLILLTHRKETLRTLNVLGIVQGILTILVPTYLIGVCANDKMICNLLMKPTLIFSGILVILAGVIGLILLSREEPRLFAGKAASV